jgi:hypothetical protein
MFLGTVVIAATVLSTVTHSVIWESKVGAEKECWNFGRTKNGKLEGNEY